MMKLSRGIIVVIVLVIAGAAYAGYSRFATSDNPVKYVLAAARIETLVLSVAGTGQVSVTSQVDLKPKASGTITTLSVKEGQRVKAGQLVASIDASDAVRAVRNAETALETAKLSLERLQRPTDELTKLQSQNALIDAKSTKANAEASLARSYEDGFNDVADAFLDFPAIMTGLSDILFLSDFNGSGWNVDGYADAVRQHFPIVQTYRDDAEVKYRAARASYDRLFQEYKSLTRDSDNAAIEELIMDAADISAEISEALKSVDNLIRYYSDKTTERGLTPKPIATTHLTKIGGFISTANGHFTSLSSMSRAITDAKEAITKAERTIVEREKSLAELDAGPDDFDVRSANIVVSEREVALADARATLADYALRAPFDGIVAKISAKRGDEVSGSTVVATLISEQKTAVISLNEVDAAAVKAGQKAVLTFDAVEGLSMSGTVASIDALGTVSQGVVSYSVIIAFDVEDERVKPGMSVSASIVSDVHADALLVPSGAVKYRGEAAYVEVPASSDGLSASMAPSGIELPVPPVSRNVSVGVTDGISIEILDGLAEGDLVVVRTVQATASQAATPTQSIIPRGSSVRIQGGGSGFRTN